MTATEIRQTGYSTKHLQIYQSIFVFYETHAMNYFASLGIFYASGMQDAEVTNSVK